jgi:hypothetical protein
MRPAVFVRLLRLLWCVSVLCSCGKEPSKPSGDTKANEPHGLDLGKGSGNAGSAARSSSQSENVSLPRSDNLLRYASLLDRSMLAFEDAGSFNLDGRLVECTWRIENKSILGAAGGKTWRVDFQSKILGVFPGLVVITEAGEAIKIDREYGTVLVVFNNLFSVIRFYQDVLNGIANGDREMLANSVSEGVEIVDTDSSEDKGPLNAQTIRKRLLAGKIQIDTIRLEGTPDKRILFSTPWSYFIFASFGDGWKLVEGALRPDL